MKEPDYCDKSCYPNAERLLEGSSLDAEDSADYIGSMAEIISECLVGDNPNVRLARELAREITKSAGILRQNVKGNIHWLDRRGRVKESA
jgi:hypothetical protein